MAIRQSVGGEQKTKADYDTLVRTGIRLLLTEINIDIKTYEDDIDYHAKLWAKKVYLEDLLKHDGKLQFAKS